MKTPKQHTIKSHGLDLSVFEFEGEGAPILLVHASGFHARCWDKVVSLLGNRHVFAVDLMGHGRSENPSLPLSWNQFTQNIIDLIEAFDLKGIVGVGHSLGGYCMAEAASKLPERFQQLVLFDPVIFNPKHAQILNRFKPEELPVSRRHSHFDSPEDMIKRLSGKGSFGIWDPEVFKDYCVYGLLPSKHGAGYDLACPPLIESATYVASGSPEIYEAISKVNIPVLVVRARDRRKDESPFSFEYSPTNPNLASLFSKGKDLKLETHSHFIPMEDPKLTAKLILAPS